MKNYFRIYFGEDFVSVENLTKDEVLNMVNSEPDCVSEKMSNDLGDGKSQEWPENCVCYKSIIIKGEIIIPEPVEKITEYKIK